MNEETPIPNSDPDVQRVSDAVAALGEHFESVAILVTRANPGYADTTQIAQTGGNFSASRGIIREWLIREDERTRAKLRMEMAEEHGPTPLPGTAAKPPPGGWPKAEPAEPPKDAGDEWKDDE